MTVKVTRKNLKEIASNLDNCYYITGNVYDYENIIEYIQNYNITSNEVMKYMNSSKYKNIDELEYIICRNKDLGYKMNATQLFYSVGLYGNSGQLHKIQVYDKESNFQLSTFYVYYC